jgi:hypothetical protein
MIEKMDGIFKISCDICGEIFDKDFYDFYDVVDYKKSEGWRSRKISGGWEEICPDCVEYERGLRL